MRDFTSAGGGSEATMGIPFTTEPTRLPIRRRDHSGFRKGPLHKTRQALHICRRDYHGCDRRGAFAF